jgi:hypothetical protein
LTIPGVPVKDLCVTQRHQAAGVRHIATLLYFGVHPSTVFLLSPASCAGTRAQMLLRSRTSALAHRLRAGGAPIGEVFTFMSSLYFRGKLAYARAFGAPPHGWPGALVIAPGRGLLPADVTIQVEDLEAMAAIPVDPRESRYREPLVRDAMALENALGPQGSAVLLGSVATEKYAGPLGEVLGMKLLFPPSFVGRGDMSRGGLLLRCARAATPLEYIPVRGAIRNGSRPPRLERIVARRGKPARRTK